VDLERFAPEEFEAIWDSQGTDPKAKLFIKRKDIPGIVRAEVVTAAWHEWQRWKRFGLAHADGWVRERPIYVRAIEICEQELDHWQYMEIKKRE
jgi:hypothetical protein